MVPFLAIYRPWGGRWRLPLMYAHDANFHAMLVQTMRLTGGFRSTSQLGAPFGQHLEDFPLGTDQAHLLALRALSFVIRDPYVVLDAYYAASFLLVALAAFALLRALGLGRPFAHVGAVLFAYLPYHFWHASARIFLSAYFAVPLGLLLAFWLTTGGVPTRAALRRKSAEHRSARWRLAAIAGCVAIVGCSSPYYAVFSITIIAATCALHAIGDRDRRSIVAGAAVITGIVGVALVSLLPDLLWLRSNPSGASVTSRPLSDADQHGLRLTQVLLPSSRERLAGWIGQGPRARAVVPAEDDAYIGVIGAVGLVIGLVVVLSALSSRRRDHARPPGVRFAATTVVIAILFAEVGGFGFLLSVLGLEQIRTWSRMVLQLALCSLFLGLWYVDRGLARVLAAVRHRARRHASVRVARSRSVPVVAAGAILVLGLADVVPVRGVVPDWHAVEAAVRSDRGFVVGMERELGPGSMVFQLPIADFPEGPPSGRMDVYDLLKGYLSGTGVLSWSHGEVKGRGAEWQHQWARQPARRLVRGLAAAGFDAPVRRPLRVPRRRRGARRRTAPAARGPVGKSRQSTAVVRPPAGPRPTRGRAGGHRDRRRRARRHAVPLDHRDRLDRRGELGDRRQQRRCGRDRGAGPTVVGDVRHRPARGHLPDRAARLRRARRQRHGPAAVAERASARSGSTRLRRTRSCSSTSPMRSRRCRSRSSPRPARLRCS